MNGIDFNNVQGSNLGDPKFGQDAVNLRTAKNLISNSLSNPTGEITANTISVYSASINTITATTIYPAFIQLAPLDNIPDPSPGLMFYDGFINKLCIFSGATFADLVILY